MYVHTAPAAHILEDPERVGLLAAELVANRLRAYPEARIFMPTGNTPRVVYAYLRSLVERGQLDFSAATLMQMDAYCGLAADDKRSYRNYLADVAAQLGWGRVHEVAGDAADEQAECERYQRLVDAAPVRLALLGIGRNGHVAFNEPGSEPHERTRPVVLAESTRVDASADFGGAALVPTRALTVGLRDLLRCHELILLVTGPAKAAALARMLVGPVSADCPASFLREHPRLTIICDAAAADTTGGRSRGGGSS